MARNSFGALIDKLQSAYNFAEIATPMYPALASPHRILNPDDIKAIASDQWGQPQKREL